MPLRVTPKSLFLHVRATPKAGRDEVAGLTVNAAGQKALAVKVSAPADKGKANAAVIAALAAALGFPKSSFRLHSGETSREKVFLVLQAEAAVRRQLERFSP